MEANVSLSIRDVMSRITACKTERDARELMRELRLIEPVHAGENVRYLLGYLSTHDRERLKRLFQDLLY
jgi:hypothetical protein